MAAKPIRKPPVPTSQIKVDHLGAPETGPAKFRGSKSCGNTASCRSDKGVVLAKGGGYVKGNARGRSITQRTPEQSYPPPHTHPHTHTTTHSPPPPPSHPGSASLAHLLLVLFLSRRSVPLAIIWGFAIRCRCIAAAAARSATPECRACRARRARRSCRWRCVMHRWSDAAGHGVSTRGMGCRMCEGCGCGTWGIGNWALTPVADSTEFSCEGCTQTRVYAYARVYIYTRACIAYMLRLRKRAYKHHVYRGGLCIRIYFADTEAMAI